MTMVTVGYWDVLKPWTRDWFRSIGKEDVWKESIRVGEKYIEDSEKKDAEILRMLGEKESL